MLNRTLRRAAAFAVLLGEAAMSATVIAADYEFPPVLEAAHLLDRSLLQGEHHDIEPQVTNDGFMNHFTIRSDFGTFEVRSQAMVPVRVREVQA